MKGTKQQKEDALVRLHELIKPGDTVYTELVHVSRSGMLRTVRLFVMVDNEPREITYETARVTPYNLDANSGALKVTGCGSDVGFMAVYSLARALYPDGFTCAGEKCQSNDHSNGVCARDGKHHHRDGGYAFRQSWL